MTHGSSKACVARASSRCPVSSRCAKALKEMFEFLEWKEMGSSAHSPKQWPSWSLDTAMLEAGPA